MKHIDKLILAPVLAGFTGSVLAAAPVPVSEPGVLSLLGVAGIIAAVAAIRRRWK